MKKVNSGKRILLVEDHPDDELLTLHTLKKHQLTDVVVRHEGHEALTYLFEDDEYHVECRDYLPKLILLDLRLPKMDGFEFLQKLRSDERTRHIPVVVLSSSQYWLDIERCKDLGVEAFIGKPLTAEKMDVLLGVLRKPG